MQKNANLNERLTGAEIMQAIRYPIQMYVLKEPEKMPARFSGIASP